MGKSIRSHEVVEASCSCSVTQHCHWVPVSSKILEDDDHLYDEIIAHDCYQDNDDLYIFLYPVQGCDLVEDAKVARDPTRCSAVHIQKTWILNTFDPAIKKINPLCTLPMGPKMAPTCALKGTPFGVPLEFHKDLMGFLETSTVSLEPLVLFKHLWDFSRTVFKKKT